MHCTRVTVLKLSFNGRQCQKLSLSISLVFVSLPSEQSMLICLFRYGFAKNSFYYQRSVDCFELSRITWICNGRYRTLLELLSCRVSVHVDLDISLLQLSATLFPSVEPSAPYPSLEEHSFYL